MTEEIADTINWKDYLGWTEEQIEDLRFAGYSYIRQGKYEIALPFFEALSVVDPDELYDQQTLGALFLQVGNPSKALRFLDKALLKNPTHVPTLLNRTKSLLLLGYKEKGLRLAKKLQQSSEPFVANSARALVLAYDKPANENQDRNQSGM
jgi:tetratricopeptide (TPR) repeat protein